MNFGLKCEPVEKPEELHCSEIEMIKRTRASVEVLVDPYLPEVEIVERGFDGEGFCLQEHEADEFLKEVNEVWNMKDITDEDAVYYVASIYADSL